FWHAARLAPLGRLLRLHRWGYQLRFLRRPGRLDQLLGARGEGEVVGLGEPDHGLELLRRDDDVGLVPLGAGQTPCGPVVVLGPRPADSEPTGMFTSAEFPDHTLRLWLEIAVKDTLPELLVVDADREAGGEQAVAGLNGTVLCGST